MIASPKVIPPRAGSTHHHHASKVYYRSESRTSPEPNAPLQSTPLPLSAPLKHLGQKAGSSNSGRGRSSSAVVVRQQLQDLAVRLHSSQERENEALGKLLTGLGHMVPTDDHGSVANNTSLDTTTTSSIVGASHRLQSNKLAVVETSGSSNHSHSSSRRHHHEGGVSESPVVVRQQHQHHHQQQSSPHSSSRVSSSLSRASTPSVRVQQQHALERSSSDFHSVHVVDGQQHVQVQPSVFHELVEENDALRQEVAKYRERSEAQQDHINRLLMCINKYEATTVTPVRRHSTRRNTRHATTTTPLSEEASPRYATHTTSSLYRRGPTHDSDRTAHSASNSHHQEVGGASSSYHDPNTPHSSLRATPPNPRRHLHHNPLLSESTLELLRMAEMRVADGSSFMSP